MAELSERVLEVERTGRRPRYHRGAVLENGQLVQPEQCNLDQVVSQINELPALPERIVRPWSQLCRRCWRGTAALVAALEAQAAYRSRHAVR